MAGPGSLRTRLFLAVTLAVLVSIGVTLGVGTVLLRSSVRRAVLGNLGRQADLLAARELGRPLTPRQLDAVERVFLRLGERVVLVPEAPLSLPIGQRQALAEGRPVEGEGTFRGRTLLYAGRPVGQQVLLVFRPARLGYSDWRPFVGGFLVAGLIGLAIAAASSFFLARAIAGPVRRVADAAQRMAGGERPGPIPEEGSEELARLASSFNDMAGEIERAREAEQAFLLSVSHELKSPLTAIRGYAEGLTDGALEGPEAGRVIGAESARLERLVQDLLELARLNRRSFAVRRERVDLATVAREAAGRYQALARTFGVDLRVEAPSGAPATGDADRVLQVVSNLVENAIRSTPSGGRVWIEADPGVVAVRDTGPGLAPEDLPRAFERFHLHERYGRERQVGSGLGLAIVKELAEAMGGTVSVESRLGAGTVFTVRLPPPSPQPAMPAPPPAAPI